MPKAEAKADTILVADESFVGQLPDGSDFVGKRNVTRIRSNHIAYRLWPHLFKPLDVTFPEVEAATAAPGEKRGAA
jgi:hypothetical protein